MALLPVKYFSSSMEGAPQLSNAWGALTNLLDACLTDGFNLKAVTTLTRAGGIVTVDIAAGHLFTVDQVVLLEGATQTDYNGEWRVLTATANSLTFAITTTPVSPATGTMSVKTAPLNFERVFTGTDKRVFRSKNVQSNRPYLRVDNAKDPLYGTAYAKKAKVQMAQGMSDIDTFVGAYAPFDAALPAKGIAGTGSGTSCIDGWYKWYYTKAANQPTGDSSSSETLNRPWTLIGDDRGFYLMTAHSSQSGKAGYCFTDFESYRQGDGFNTLLCATDWYFRAIDDASIIDSGYYVTATMANRFHLSLDFTGKVLMRDHMQVGGNVRVGFASLSTANTAQTSGYQTGVPWPNGPDNSLILHPIYLRQENGHIRGRVPGYYWVLNDQPLSDGSIVENVAGFPGRKFMLVGMPAEKSGNNLGELARVAFDITGPWW